MSVFNVNSVKSNPAWGKVMNKQLDRGIMGFCHLGLAGLAPKAPGTWGAALACVIAPFVFLPLDFFGRWLCLTILFFSGAFAGSYAERKLNKKDPGEVVIDELVGVWFAMAPFADWNWLFIIAAFILFRIFDILKPWPVNVSERWLPDGFGIMIDDVVAGAYAMLGLAILFKIIFI